MASRPRCQSSHMVVYAASICRQNRSVSNNEHSGRFFRRRSRNPLRSNGSVAIRRASASYSSRLSVKSSGNPTGSEQTCCYPPGERLVPAASAPAAPTTAHRSPWCGHYRAAYPGTDRPGGGGPSGLRVVIGLRTRDESGSIPRAAASLRKFVSASPLSRNSHSTLPSTAFNSRIQTSNTADVIFQLLLKQQNTKPSAGKPELLPCRRVRARSCASASFT